MRTKVLVVDDSVFMRVVLSRMLVTDPSLEVVGTAQNGVEAIEKVTALQPDVVTLDVEMPMMNSLHALQRIMAIRPTPVIMLSALTTDGANITFDCLKYGAFDFLIKPEGMWRFQELSEELITKVKAAATTPVSMLSVRTDIDLSEQVGHLGANTTPKPPQHLHQPDHLHNPRIASSIDNGLTGPVTQIVAIGTSTGGPSALDVVLSRLPRDLAAALVIVQHMPPPFTESLAQRLNAHSHIEVVEAADGQCIRNGVAYIAPGGYHMEVAEHHGNFCVALNQGDKRNQHRPSVDVLFESVAELNAVKQHFLLMTGMGHDGAQGMRLGKKRGAKTTMVQSPESCVVSGMPKSALELACVSDIVPLESISARLVDIINSLT
jgi:two-component system, chemotaxis family, protein-glutamate methylesterase/glutaminase